MILLPFVLAIARFDHPQLLSGIGHYHRQVVTTKPLAQRYFDQGLSLFYAFHKTQSKMSFQEAVRIDPQCAMAWWGVAMADGPDINNPAVDADASKAAIAALARARGAAKKPIERSLIEATSRRYALTAPTNRQSLDQAYCDSLRQLWTKNPSDPDIGSLYAESLLILRPWNQWSKDGKPAPGTLDAVKTLETILGKFPAHPMANHIYIHAVEASPHPEKALPSADLLCTLQPSLGHMVHMPSHIYVRTGRWAKAVKQNELADEADNSFSKRGAIATTYLPYLAHNRMMLAYAAMMIGQSRKAVGAMKEFQALVPPDMLKTLAPMLDGYLFTPLEIQKRFGMWDAMLATPDFISELPISRAMRHGERAIAFAAKNMPDDAQAELTWFREARAKVSKESTVGLNPASAVLDIEEHFAQGEVFVQRGNFTEGLEELRKAVATEDQLAYDEPPDWIQPARHTLGAAYLKARMYDEALKVYQEDLRRLPENGWSTLGVSQAYAGLGQPAKAAAWRKKFDKIWAQADMPITSSCVCLPR